VVGTPISYVRGPSLKVRPIDRLSWLWFFTILLDRLPQILRSFRKITLRPRPKSITLCRYYLPYIISRP